MAWTIQKGFVVNEDGERVACGVPLLTATHLRCKSRARVLVDGEPRCGVHTPDSTVGRSRGRSIDETGKRYGALLVVGRAAGVDSRGAVWACICDCGQPVERLGIQLRKGGGGQSCGCGTRRK